MDDVAISEFELDIGLANAAVVERTKANEVHLYCLTFPHHFDLGPSFPNCLSTGELERAASFQFARDRERFVLSHAFARKVLARYLGIAPGEVTLDRGYLGKPVIAAGVFPRGETLGFSLAHCKTHVVVAVAATALVGVDVEQQYPNLDVLGMARGHFAAEETQTLSKIPSIHASSHFTRLWTCKEAFVKAIGLGLSYPLDRFVVSGLERGKPEYSSMEPDYGPPAMWSLATYTPAHDCHVAVAARLPDAVMTCFRGTLCERRRTN